MSILLLAVLVPAAVAWLYIGLTTLFFLMDELDDIGILALAWVAVWFVLLPAGFVDLFNLAEVSWR